MKLNNKKGFTLMEMLIVVAIIAILIAIAIPTMNSSLTKSKQAADNANVRAAYAQAMTDYLTKTADDATASAKTAAMQADYDGSTSIAGVTGITWSKGQIVTVSIAADGTVTIAGAAS